AQHPISETQLKQAYQTYFVENAPTEYKVHHILVETETKAQQIIEALNDEQSFAKLAQKHSTDTLSAKKQGDLGWLTPDKVEPSIAEALQGLKKQSYTSKPVNSSFGWHIVFLEDKRQSKPPPFAAVKDKLEALLQPQLLKNYINKLKEQAEIKVIKQIELAQEQPAEPTSTEQTATPVTAE
ncbi:MAG: peptidylprolyl isomerase, partial [Pseudomonadota bacterium]|nr:peptidylprolyl isomerase [Pseudomonadota bacterium]